MHILCRGPPRCRRPLNVSLRTTYGDPTEPEVLLPCTCISARNLRDIIDRLDTRTDLARRLTQFRGSDGSDRASRAKTFFGNVSVPRKDFFSRSLDTLTADKSGEVCLLDSAVR